MRVLAMTLVCLLIMAGCETKPDSHAECGDHEHHHAEQTVEPAAVFPQRLLKSFPELIVEGEPSVDEVLYEQMVAGVSAIDDWFKTTNQTDETLAAAVATAGFASFEELDSLSERLMEIVEVRDGLLMIEKELGNPEVAPMLKGDEPMTALFPIRLKPALELVREAIPAKGYTMGDFELAAKYELEIRRARGANHPIASIRRIRRSR